MRSLMWHCVLVHKGGQYKLPSIEGETVLQFCERLGLVSSLPPLSQNTSAVMLFQDKKCLNRCDKRHLLLKDCANITKVILMILTQYANPNDVALMIGNLDPTTFTPELDECCICMETFIVKKGFFRSQIVALPCKHRFHKQCVLSQQVDTCPLCRADFDAESL